MWRLVSVIAALVVVFFSRSASAAVELYTVGPGSYLFSRYGHSLLCVDTRCYDYGVPDREDAVHMGWASIRGQPIFIAVGIDKEVAVKTFKDQGRQLEKQILPLSFVETQKLTERLERDVATRAAYAYHPYFANCTTQLRDRIDEVTEGRLRKGKNDPVQTRFRDMSEAGLSGKLFELTALAFLLGGPSERKPTQWEAMFLPEGLRDGVRDRFGASIEKVAEQQAVVLPTSRAVGRIVLIVLAVVLASVVRFSAKRARMRIGIATVAIVLGVMAIVAELVALLVVWPEFRQNWALAVLLPTDLAMPWLHDRYLRIYAMARAGLAAVLLLLEIGGVIAQPLIPVCVLVLLPMFAIVSTLRDRSLRAA
jgi:hypothetical protein